MKIFGVGFMAIDFFVRGEEMDDGDDLQLSPQIINFLSIKFLNVLFSYRSLPMYRRKTLSLIFFKKIRPTFCIGWWLDWENSQANWQKDPIDDYGESKGLNWLTL
jgi:hypothetical protein